MIAVGEEAALTVDRLVKRFGGVVAVDDVSFTLRRGERMAVIGPNGAGKTTLFKLIAGELRATSGSTLIFGADVSSRSDARRARAGLSRTFQVSNLFGALTVADNVRLALLARRRNRWRPWPDASVRRRGEAVTQALASVALEHRAGVRVADLSHGEQRQLEIAMALLNEPRILLLDEPAAGLSEAERVVLRDLIRRLPPDLAVLLIEHDMSLALDLTQKVLCLHNGVPIAMGAPGEVRADPTVRTVYLGRAGAA
ncbi:MAG: ABC transporter ATP-binding protein [Nocardioidaceae bacterium]|nr:ABC transporter ATP-binding protein [Nocardioidaceae bacterium]